MCCDASIEGGICGPLLGIRWLEVWGGYGCFHATGLDRGRDIGTPDYMGDHKKAKKRDLTNKSSSLLRATCGAIRDSI